MTIPSTASEVAYAGNGITTVLPVPFVFDTSSDLLVKQQTAGVISTITTGFIVSGGDGSTGQVTFLVAPATGTNTWIFDNPAVTQPTDYIDNDAFPAESHERALDRVTRIVKRLTQQVGRTVRFPDADSQTNGELADIETRKGKYLFFDAITGAVTYAISVVGTTLTQLVFNSFLADSDAYKRTPAEISGGIIPTNYGYPPNNALRYMSSAQISDVISFTGSVDVTAALQTLYNLCANNSYLAYMPAGKYRISSALTFPCEQGGGIYLEGAAFAANGTKDSQILVTGSGYVALTITGKISELTLAVGGTLNSCDGVQLGRGQNTGIFILGHVNHLRVHNLNGFGVNIKDPSDCYFEDISIELCGNSSKYAFSMNAVDIVPSECTFNRLQVEQSNALAMFIEQSSLNCAFTKIHSERTIGNGVAATHVIGGDNCWYGAVRCEATSNVVIIINGADNDIGTLRAGGATIFLQSGTSQTFRGNKIEHMITNSVMVPNTNVAPWEMRNSLISTGLTITDQPEGKIKAIFCTIADIAVNGNTSRPQFVDCNITGTWVSTGNNTIEMVRCKTVNLPQNAVLILRDCTVSAAFSFATNQLVQAFSTTFAAALTLSANTGSAVFAYDGCKFDGNLVGAGGLGFGVLDMSCRVKQGNTVATDWFGTPGGLPGALASWDQGTIRFNPLPATAGFIGSVCTTGSAVGAGTWKTFGLIS